MVYFVHCGKKLFESELDFCPHCGKLICITSNCVIETLPSKSETKIPTQIHSSSHNNKIILLAIVILVIVIGSIFIFFRYLDSKQNVVVNSSTNSLETELAWYIGRFTVIYKEKSDFLSVYNPKTTFITEIELNDQELRDKALSTKTMVVWYDAHDIYFPVWSDSTHGILYYIYK